jgi:hypothetical protein
MGHARPIDRRRPERSRAGGVAACFTVSIAVLVWAACAPKQRVPLDLGPAPVELYVDGALATEVPLEVKLRADRDHKIFVKRAGYVPELVVLETREVDGRYGLAPAEVRIRLRPIAGDPDLEIEEEDPDGPGDAPGSP